MKAVNYISAHIYVAESANRDRGVFTKSDVKKNTVVEIAPVIVMSKSDRSFLDQTLLHDYIFEWGEDQCCMALGYLPVYNHSYQANCEYEMDFRNRLIKVRTVTSIKAGEELFINYNGDWNNKKAVWFDVK